MEHIQWLQKSIYTYIYIIFIYRYQLVIKLNTKYNFHKIKCQNYKSWRNFKFQVGEITNLDPNMQPKLKAKHEAPALNIAKFFIEI